MFPAAQQHGYAWNLNDAPVRLTIPGMNNNNNRPPFTPPQQQQGWGGQPQPGQQQGWGQQQQQGWGGQPQPGQQQGWGQQQQQGWGGQQQQQGWGGPPAEALATPPGFQMTEQQVNAENAAFMRKVYAIMAGGLLLTAVISVITANSPFLMEIIFGNRIVFYGLLFAELGAVLAFSAIAERASAFVAGALFTIYAALNGLTLSCIFLIYTASSVASTFVICAGMFGGMSAFGYLTKRDLSGWGHFAIMGLWGIILAGIANIFMQSPMISWVTSMCGVVVFTLLTAYDTQKIRDTNIIGNAGTDEDNKEAIHGALILYLDFINLFLKLLQLFGRRK